MTALAATPVLHPLQPVAECVETITDALERLPSGPLSSTDADVLEVIVVEAARAERRLRELRPRLARAAETSRAAQVDGSSGADAWLAKLTGSTAAVMRGGLWLARMLEERYPAVGEAFAEGGLGEAHARIIVRAAEEMPRVVSDEDRAAAVESLVEEAVARRMNTKTLRRRARRMLDVINREHADQHEAELLKKDERHAHNETWMDLQDNGDGTWSGRFVIPELHGQLLATHLQHLSSPRRMTRNLAGDPVIDRTVADATGKFHGLSWTESMGMALLELCEHLPTDGLAQHGRVGATVVIHLDHDRLLDGLAAAHLDSGGELSVSETRRLACGAGILPAVYAGRVCRSTSAASRGWTAKVNGSRCPGSTTAVPPKAASARSRGARSTTHSPGWPEAGPISTTRCRCAAGTTGARTAAATTCAGSPPARSGSGDDPRTRRPLHAGRPPATQESAHRGPLVHLSKAIVLR